MPGQPSAEAIAARQFVRENADILLASVLDSSIDQSPRQTMVSVGVVDLRVDAGKNIEDEISE